MDNGKRSRRVVPADLPALAMAHPAVAAWRAREVLGSSPTPREATFAWHALGIVERDDGRVGSALRQFRTGLRLARSAGLEDRRIDLAASLGTALGLAGRRRAALNAFEEALSLATEGQAAQVLVKRSAARANLGDPTGALDDARRATGTLNRLGERLWEARARHNWGGALLALGLLPAAEEQLAVAQSLAEAEGEVFGATTIVHTRGDCAHRRGDLPRALRLLYEARERYKQLGAVPPEVLRDLSVVQLAAGLTEEAAGTADELVVVLERDRDSVLRRADGFIAAAIVHLAAGNPDQAIHLASRAARACRRQGHPGAERHARVVLLRAQAATGRVGVRQARAAAGLAAEIADRYSAERLDALVLAGRLGLATGLTDLAQRSLRAASADRHRGSALRRSTAWYAAALLAQTEGDRAGMLRACRRGLDVLDTHTLSLGATELRARATVHSSDLAVLATRQVAADGRPGELLSWTERWRSSLHSLPRPDIDDDPVLAAELGRLRAADGRFGMIADPGLEAERRRIEERIRRHVHARNGDATRRRFTFDLGDLTEQLSEDRTLISIVGINGDRFHAVVVRQGKVRHVLAGPVDGIQNEVEYARFALRGAAVADDAVADALLASAAPGLGRLEETILGPAVSELGDGPVVLVPPSTLHGVPWGALPSLRERAVTVAPSATAWLRAHMTKPPDDRRTVLIGGAGLTSSAAELGMLAEAYPEAVVLNGAAATADAALSALNGAWLAHIGAHGRYRRDNPMFSALEFTDGPLTVYDLEHLRSPPYRMLLTACESGVGSPIGTDELLGLASSLSALGTAGLLASVVPVSDAASVGFSLVVHERLRDGDDLSAAVLAARRAARTPVDTATAWSFLALGAA